MFHPQRDETENREAVTTSDRLPHNLKIHNVSVCMCVMFWTCSLLPCYPTRGLLGRGVWGGEVWVRGMQARWGWVRDESTALSYKRRPDGAWEWHTQTLRGKILSPLHFLYHSLYRYHLLYHYYSLSLSVLVCASEIICTDLNRWCSETVSCP